MYPYQDQIEKLIEVMKRSEQWEANNTYAPFVALELGLKLYAVDKYYDQWAPKAFVTLYDNLPEDFHDDEVVESLQFRRMIQWHECTECSADICISNKTEVATCGDCGHKFKVKALPQKLTKFLGLANKSVWKERDIQQAALYLTELNRQSDDTHLHLLLGALESEDNRTWNITPEQSRKGLEYLRDKCWTARGKVRAGCPFEPEDLEILARFDKFYFLGFTEAEGNKFSPIYRVVSKSGDFFDYYMEYGKPVKSGF